MDGDVELLKRIYDRFNAVMRGFYEEMLPTAGDGAEGSGQDRRL
jgi:hypothetical protein